MLVFEAAVMSVHHVERHLYRGKSDPVVSSYFQHVKGYVRVLMSFEAYVPEVKDLRDLCFRNVPCCSSSNACLSCSCVFITIGLYHATGSSSGFPEISSVAKTECAAQVHARAFDSRFGFDEPLNWTNGHISLLRRESTLLNRAAIFSVALL